jgi:hypothetical protein
MRKSSKLIVVAGALAALAVPSVASADVPRCQTTGTGAATTTFTVTTPSGAGGDWTTAFTVTARPDGSFSGTGVTTGMDYDGPKTIDEMVTGTFTDNNADGKADSVSFTSTRPQPLYTGSWTVNNAPLNGTPTQGSALGVDWPLVFKVTGEPQLGATTTTDLNHGEYVKSQGGGKAAAQSCVGMPLNSKQGK